MRNEDPTRQRPGIRELSVNNPLTKEGRLHHRLDASAFAQTVTSPIMHSSFDADPKSTHHHWSPATHLFDIKPLGELIFERIRNDRAKIGVVVPLYNYANFIEECLDSVVRQDLDHLSLVVIDDCSTDASCDTALKLIIANADRFSVTRLIRHRRNQGPAMARNSGIVWSDEPTLFLLDADNRIRPPALSRLFEALLSSEAEFAYSQLCFFGARSGLGIADIWSIEHLRRETYIDMMALIKREALVRAGGIAPLADDGPWEDHNLWCCFAELGYRGVFLPELLCEYRVHDLARTRAAEGNVDLLYAEIALRHPPLFNHSMAAGDCEHGLHAGQTGEAHTFPTVTDKPEHPLHNREAASGAGSEALNSHLEAGDVILPRFQGSLRAHPAWAGLEPLLVEFFDPIWYETKYPDLGIYHEDPFEQFVVSGAQHLRDPCGEFQTTFYLSQNPYLGKSGEIPVVDYLLYGRREGRPPKIYHIQELDIVSGYQLACRSSSSRKVSVLLHLYHVDLFSELANYIDNVTVEKDISVNLVDQTWTPLIHDEIRRRWPSAKVIISPDNGRDIGGFSRLLSTMDFAKYDLFLFVHSKKSPHLPEYKGRAWRRSLLDPIVGSPAVARTCIEGMRVAPTIGITAAKKWRDFSVFTDGQKYKQLLDMAFISSTARDCEFVAGTMFFIKTDVVRRLYSVIRQISFEDGDGAIDGQYAHSVERLIGNLVRDEGLCFRWM